MGQEVQVRISDINTDNNTVNLSMVPAGAYDDRSGGGYGKILLICTKCTTVAVVEDDVIYGVRKFR